MEDTICVGGRLPESERAAFLAPLISPSAKAAAAEGRSLALVRPEQTKFYYRRKSSEQIYRDRENTKKAASQGSFFDTDLAAIEPTPYHFRFRFNDADGQHDYSNADWEAHAWFFRLRNKLGSEELALAEMSRIFNEVYPAKGILFAIGNIAKRPQTWQLLGVLRVDTPRQASLF